jgi:hypothetical protein
MPVKLLPKSNEKEPVVHTVEVTKQEKTDLKNLRAEMKSIIKECSAPLDFNEDLIIKVYINDALVDVDTAGMYPYDDEICIFIGEMKAKKKEISEMSRLIMLLWNSHYELNTWDFDDRVYGMKLKFTEEITRRTKALDTVNGKFTKFFKNMEKERSIPGMYNAIQSLNSDEYEILMDAILTGKTVLLS